ncbi:Stromal cell-derived factor 2 [Zancudomyces culisetae]|uniref:Stromal cell-derived factor 2 n=1 Tax=Zancudomyces culisetae TaxID=1213189 RepID=A0A1R1PUC5_ZANCU|nr:Stromal cell-derived factor 2 [Zancudomyces culisetae]|eukprot:OMH84596.1 Stromal cell-derived factor 2 [Zancudomyces culisetae]
MPDEDLFLGSGSDHRSPLSENQEVSGVAEHEIGNVWKVECSKKDEFWVRDTPIKLVHKDTGAYLQAIPGKVFGAPIDGNLEVSCSKNPKSSNHEWAVMEGFFFKEQ